MPTPDDEDKSYEVDVAPDDSSTSAIPDAADNAGFQETTSNGTPVKGVADLLTSGHLLHQERNLTL